MSSRRVCDRGCLCILLPVRKWLPRARAKRDNKLAYFCAPIEQAADQFFERAPVTGIPLWWNPISTVPDKVVAHALYRRKPGLKRIPTAHAQINFILRINAAQRLIWK